MNYKLYGNPEAEIYIIRVTGEHERDQLEYEIAELKKLCNEADYCLIYVQVKSWEDDLAPWSIEAGNDGTYKTRASETLRTITDEIITEIDNKYPIEGRRYYLAGYSLAGLFSLWAAYNTDAFSGIAAVSPSVWYPGWLDYIEDHSIKTKDIYLSLGNKEQKTRNQMMAKVRFNLLIQYNKLISENANAFLEMNKGNHFKDAGLRMVKGMAWLIKITEK